MVRTVLMDRQRAPAWLWLALVAPAQAARVNKNPGFIQVYDANVENLETPGEFCKGDWQDLIFYMKVQPLAPDLFIVQQVSGRGQLNTLTTFMSRNLPGRYKVSLPHLNRSGGRERREHAGPSCQARHNSSRLGSIRHHELEQPRDGVVTHAKRELSEPHAHRIVHVVTLDDRVAERALIERQIAGDV